MQVQGSCWISSVETYLPAEILESDVLMAESNCQRFGIPVDYINRFIGIRERRASAANERPSDLAAMAAKSALNSAQLSANDIDLVIFAGITRDYEEPSTAHLVQEKIQANNAVCMDITNACLGFMSSISVADAYIRAGVVRQVLICTGETPTKMFPEVLRILQSLTDKSEFKKTLGFLTAGDAGAAMVLQAPPEPELGLQWVKYRSKGQAAQLCYYEKVGGTLKGEMLMKEISREIVTMHSEMIDETYDRLQWCPESIDWVYAHQVGKKPHQLLSKIAQQSIKKMPATFPQFGNLTSATIPVAMALNRPKRGDKVMFMGTGSGLSICQGGMVF